MCLLFGGAQMGIQGLFWLSWDYCAIKNANMAHETKYNANTHLRGEAVND